MMKTGCKSLALLLSGLLFAAGTIVRAAESDTKIGILALYDGDQLTGDIAGFAIPEENGCQVRRAGIIETQLGDIGLDQPSQFVFLACRDGLLSTPDRKKVLTGLQGSPRMLAILEGSLQDLDALANEPGLSTRQYILKISHYNNLDIEARDRDLREIGRLTTKRDDQYTNESYVGVTHAMGMPTPDEVVVISYQSPDHGARFRKNNPDIMALIGTFNKRHLGETIYYSGKALE